MSEFEASIKASRLKHAVSVLHRVNDESIFEVCDNEITSRVVNAANAAMVEVTISYDGTDDITAPEARQILITPFDPQTAGPIGKAIEKAKEYIKKLLDGSFGKYESTIRRVDMVFNTPKGE